MKDPTGLHREAWPPGEDEPPYCYHDGEKYPCKAVRKWMKSPEYRVAALEKKVASLAKALDAAEQARRDDAAKLSRLDLLVRGGLMHAFSELSQGRAGGTITESIETDEIFAGCEDGWARYIPGLRHHHVVYESPALKVTDNIDFERHQL